jgi:PAS domain S-box-containing protein
MVAETPKLLFFTRDKARHGALSLLIREFNASVRFVSKKPDDAACYCDLILIDLGDVAVGEVREIIRDYVPQKRCIPLIYLLRKGEEAKLLELLQYNEGAVIQEGFDADTVRSLLEVVLSTVEKRLRAEEEQQYYNALMDASIVSRTDPAGLITFANKNFCKLSGYTELELLGKNHNIIRHPDMPASAFQEMWQTITRKEVWTGRVKNRKKDGGYYIVNAMIIPILNADGEIKEYMAIRNDITQMVLMQEKITNDSEQKKELAHKQELLEEINRAKDEFLVVFTHELKTPLNAIINFSEYIAKHLEKSQIDKKEKLLDLIHSVRKNAGNMLENIINIIDISKLKAGKLTLNIMHVNLKDLVNDLRHRFEPITSQSGVGVTYRVAEECYVKSDERRLSQVVGNILSNAIKYGGGEVLLETGCEGGGFFISIEDNGPGIKDSSRIFELYEQGDENTATRTAQGTGVGLHFVKYLCRELDISIAVERSKKLGGARFVLKGAVK